MPQKRNARAAPPPRPGEWTIRHGDQACYDGWETFCNQAPGRIREAFEALTTDPRRRTIRLEQLRGKELSTRIVRGVEMQQWQYEVTGGGRIWYCVDDANKTVILMRVSPGHPKETD
jgi:hypothetical protein